MSVQHESAPSTAHHSHHHSGHTHTFPPTPVDVASQLSSEVSASAGRAADEYDEPDGLNVDSSLPASSPIPQTVALALPAQSSATVSSSAAASASSHSAAAHVPASSPSATQSSSPSSSSSSSSKAATGTSSSTSSSSSSAAAASSASSSSAFPSPSSSSSSALSAIDRLRPSLEMYRNQVAGHSPLFWHSGTICKPLIPAEYTFYAQLEQQMPAFMPFVPKFYGLLDLEQLTEEMASSLLTETTDSGSNNSNGASSATDRQRSGSGEPSRDSDDNSCPSQDAASSSSSPDKQKQSTDDGGSSDVAASSSVSTPSSVSVHSSAEGSMTANSSAGRIYNKWAMKCQLRRPGNSKARIQYIVLEDLTYAYAKPCILDLKVGTRQHSDTEPPSKIASKTARCLHTTSHSLGLRLCGMQVYHPAEGMYAFRDKYWGRGLDVDGFKRAMRDYFWDGERLVEEVVRAFVARMEKMRKAVVLWTKGRRFYSSSLLLVYEGDRNSRAGGNEHDSTHNATAMAAAVAASSGGELEKPSALRQGSDSSLTSTSSGFFSPLQSPPTASPGGSSSVGHQPLATSASMVALSTHDSALASPHTPSSHSLSHNKLGGLSSSVPSLSTVPTARATLPASFSSATLSSTFHQQQLHSSSSSISTAVPASVSAGSAGSTPPSSSSSLLSPPIKLYSHKRKTTHAQAMALARQRGSIDVRIIDFAHTSLVGEAAVAGGVVEGGSADEVDSGLLFGFDCLLELLRSILEEERQKRGTQHSVDAEADGADMQRSEQAAAGTVRSVGKELEEGSGAGTAIPNDGVPVRASSYSGVSTGSTIIIRSSV